MSVAVIADIVGSRSLPDRAAAQRALDDVIESVERDLPLAERALQPIVGDELQGVYPRLGDAMASLLLLRLALPDVVECRYGLGLGEIGEIPSRAGTLSEGPGWWAARKAIEIVHANQSRAIPGARTWVEADETAESSERAAVPLANAYLLARDQLVSAMSARMRRLAYGRLLGQTQRDLARAEGITQSAVSQALASAGVGALVAGFRLLRAGG
ncbi:MAG: SatD family protein [Microbacterium sp.]